MTSVRASPVESLEASALVEGLLALRPWPTFLVDSRTTLVAANPAGYAALSNKRDFLLRPSGDHRQTLSFVSEDLQGWVSKMCACGLSNGARRVRSIDKEDGKKSLLVLARVDGLIAVLPDGKRALAPAVLVSFNGGACSERYHETLLAEAYGLTPMEARLAVALVDGHSLKSFAEKSKISIATVRWHLSNALAKCGSTCQRDFVKIVMDVYAL